MAYCPFEDHEIEAAQAAFTAAYMREVRAHPRSPEALRAALTIWNESNDQMHKALWIAYTSGWPAAIGEGVKGAVEDEIEQERQQRRADMRDKQWMKDKLNEKMFDLLEHVYKPKDGAPLIAQIIALNGLRPPPEVQEQARPVIGVIGEVILPKGSSFNDIAEKQQTQLQAQLAQQAIDLEQDAGRTIN